MKFPQKSTVTNLQIGSCFWRTTVPMFPKDSDYPSIQAYQNRLQLFSNNLKTSFQWYFSSLLVNGIEIEIFEWKPSGGYLTNGIASVGAITRLVPGGRASLPSSVTQISLFCLEWGTSDAGTLLDSSLDFEDFGCVEAFGTSDAIALEANKRKIRHQQLTGIISFYGICKEKLFHRSSNKWCETCFNDPSTCKKWRWFPFSSSKITVKTIHSCLISNQKNNVARPCVIYFEVSVKAIYNAEIPITTDTRKKIVTQKRKLFATASHDLWLKTQNY